MEINMKNVTKVGLSALAGSLAFTSVQAGDMSISGSMITSYTKKVGFFEYASSGTLFLYEISETSSARDFRHEAYSRAASGS